MPVQEAYELFREGRELLFMDEDGKEIRVKSIEKVPCSGKIYDVDVENDIVLVRRVGDKSGVRSNELGDGTLNPELPTPNPNSEGIWSGNSNTKRVLDYPDP